MDEEKGFVPVLVKDKFCGLRQTGQTGNNNFDIVTSSCVHISTFLAIRL